MPVFAHNSSNREPRVVHRKSDCIEAHHPKNFAFESAPCTQKRLGISQVARNIAHSLPGSREDGQKPRHRAATVRAGWRLRGGRRNLREERDRAYLAAISFMIRRPAQSDASHPRYPPRGSRGRPQELIWPRSKRDFCVYAPVGPRRSR